MQNVSEKLPRWDMSNIYTGLEADDLAAGKKEYEGLLGKLESFIEDKGIKRLEAAPKDLDGAAAALEALINLLNETMVLGRRLGAFISGFTTTNTYDKIAAKKESELRLLGVRLSNSFVLFEAWIGSIAPALDALCDRSPVVKEHRQALVDIAEQSKYRMTPEMENLASELLVFSGGESLSMLQGTVTSQLKMPFEQDGKTEMLPMTAIRNLSNNPDEDVRRRAYETELEGWATIREPVAFALNGVKGTALTLAKRRGRESVLEKSLDDNMIDKETLDALLTSMKASLPIFRKYFKCKAKKLGKESLPWWDLFAPVGSVELSYTWPEVKNYIVKQFGTFSSELADYAMNAFEKNWIDAEPRDGKVGGAFCMRVPGVDESRILANFDGSFDQMSTLAHELGHGFHNHCQIGLPMMRQGSPMTLAETASIFCQTIVINAALDSSPPEAQLGILENQIMDAAQVIVDIYSRYIFETEVVSRRAESTVSADDFCEIMLDAQRQAYGDGLDTNHLHEYMWLLKPHYYSHHYNYYNFPYAFGLLFGLGVYAIYLKEGTSFIPRYKELLRSTGEGKAADLAARYGIDIRSRDFWDASIDVMAKQIERYCELD
ncbi:M3 family oligoendopeptidase [bacterium]|nr:M3 family oligoendopeptidase [bacterium]